MENMKDPVLFKENSIFELVPTNLIKRLLTKPVV